MSVRVVKLQKRHVPEAVRVHLEAFPNFFLSFLGPAFLRELYTAFAKDEAAVALAAERVGDGALLGFVVGTTAPNGFFRRLLVRRWWAFALASLRAVCADPRIALRLLRALAYRGDAPDGDGRALLSSIAVAPEAQRLAVGLRLMEAWSSEARNSGASGAFLTTDAVGNERAIRFYERCGWRVDCSFETREGRKMLRYVADFA